MPQREAVDLARNLHILGALTERLLEGDVESGDTSASFTQVVVLKWLDAAMPRKARDVARFLSASAPAATQVLARLKRKGLLRVEPNPRDGRASDLYVTPRGRELVRRHEQRKLQLLERLLTQVPEAHRRSVATGLEAAIELLLQADTKRLDLCLHCGAHASPHCLMRRHGHVCPTERA